MARALTRREKMAAAQERARLAQARQGLQVVTDQNAARFVRQARSRQRAEDIEKTPWLAAPAWARLAYTTAKRNARKRGIKFSLTRTDIEILVTRCEGCCELSGIPFELDPHATASRRPFAPSIDRIESSKGYDRHNVRVICVAANLALNEWGDETLLRLARAIVDRADGRQ